MKGLSVFTGTLMLVSALICACSKGVVPQSTTAAMPTASVGSAESESAQRALFFMQLVSLLGMSDEQAKGQLGGGMENRTEDGETLIGRSYSTRMAEQSVSVETVYSTQNTVSAVSAFFPQMPYETLKQTLIEVFGEADVTDDTLSHDTTCLTWTYDDALIMLNESYTMSIVEFNIAAQ